MASPPTQSPGLTGATFTTTPASAGGDRVAPGTRLHVLNAGGAAVTLTITTTAKARDLAAANRTPSIPNASVPWGIDLPADLYASPSDGLVGLAWSATASVSYWVEGPVAA